MSSFLIALFAFLSPGIDDVDDAIVRFKTQWARARGGNRSADVEVKKQALTGLLVYTDDRVLAIYLDKFDREKDDGVIERCLTGMTMYRTSKEVCDVLFKRIKSLGRGSRKKSKGMLSNLFTAAEKMDWTKLKKKKGKYVDYPLDFINDREADLVISATKLLGSMKHVKSVKPLIRLMDKLQDPIRKRMRGWEPPEDILPEEGDCDGD